MKGHAKKTQRKGHLWKDYFVFWTLKQTFLELIFGNLRDKSETVS